MSRHVIEAVARYLCRDYWCDEERWDEFTEQAEAVVQITHHARSWSEGDEPPAMPDVVDRRGETWTHAGGDLWECPTSSPISWAEMLAAYGPVTEEKS